MMDLTTFMWRVFLVGMVFFMLFPLVTLCLFAFSESSLLGFPITGLTFSWFDKLFSSSKFWASFQNSLIVTGVVGAISTFIGTMAALALARMGRRVSTIGSVLISIPIMVPPLVLGVVMLTYFSGLGMRLGLQTVILAHIIFTQPFVILIVQARMATFDYAAVNSARDLGASPLRAFFTITLPIVRPTIIGAALVAMALSVDDFLVTFFTIGGGNTLPTLLWGMLRRTIDPTINIVAMVLMALTIAVSLLALRATRYRG